MEYAIRYPHNLKGLIISNKSYSQSNLVKTRTDLMLEAAKALNASPVTLDEIRHLKKISNTTEGISVTKRFNRLHLVRLDSLPDAINRNATHLTGNRYFKYFHDRDTWNFLDRLHWIQVPTLIIGAKNDFVKKEDLKQIQKKIDNSILYICRMADISTFGMIPLITLMLFGALY